MFVLLFSWIELIVVSLFSTFVAWLSLISNDLPTFQRLVRSYFFRIVRRRREFEEQFKIMCSFISLVTRLGELSKSGMIAVERFFLFLFGIPTGKK